MAAKLSDVFPRIIIAAAARTPLNTEVLYMPLLPLTKASSCIHEVVASVCAEQASVLVTVLARLASCLQLVA